MLWKSRIQTPRWIGQILRTMGPREPLIGLDIGSQTVKMVQLASKCGKWQLQYCGVESLPGSQGEENEEDSEMAIRGAIRKLMNDSHLHQAPVVCSIRGPSVMVKSIQVPIMTASEFEQHIRWEMDQYIPSDVKDIYWDYHIVDRRPLKTSSVAMSALLVAAKKEVVHRRVQLIQRSGLSPIVVDVDSLALCNLYAFNYQSGGPPGILLIHVSPSGVSLNAIHEGTPIMMREIEVGDDVFRDLLEEAVNPEPRELKKEGIPSIPKSREILLTQVYRDISLEIKRTIEFGCDMDPPLHIQQLFLDGGYSRVAGLATTIEEEVNLPLAFLDPLKKLNIPSSMKGREAVQALGQLGGVAVGLALRGTDNRWSR